MFVGAGYAVAMIVDRGLALLSLNTVHKRWYYYLPTVCGGIHTNTCTVHFSVRSRQTKGRKICRMHRSLKQMFVCKYLNTTVLNSLVKLTIQN